MFGKVENIKDNYKIGRVIGEGSFGQVRIAMNRHANVKVAIKFIKKDSLKHHQKLQELMNDELHVLQTTSHPNIVNTIELLHDDRFYFIVTEFIRYGELYDFICKKGSITEAEV